MRLGYSRPEIASESTAAALALEDLIYAWALIKSRQNTANLCMHLGQVSEDNSSSILLQLLRAREALKHALAEQLKPCAYIYTSHGAARKRGCGPAARGCESSCLCGDDIFVLLLRSCGIANGNKHPPSPHIPTRHASLLATGGRWWPHRCGVRRACRDDAGLHEVQPAARQGRPRDGEPHGHRARTSDLSREIHAYPRNTHGISRALIETILRALKCCQTFALGQQHNTDLPLPCQRMFS